MYLSTSERKSIAVDTPPRQELGPWIVGYALLGAFFFMGLLTFCCFAA